jgi:hypothetical protein
MKEYNKIIAPKGNPHEKFIDEMLDYIKKLPKTHKDKAIYQKLDEIFTSGIEVRLLNKEEYIQKLKEKVIMGQRIFLFDPSKPTTIEEIEQNKDDLWGLLRKKGLKIQSNSFCIVFIQMHLNIFVAIVFIYEFNSTELGIGVSTSG